jgi:hypothetical protein
MNRFQTRRLQSLPFLPGLCGPSAAEKFPTLSAFLRACSDRSVMYLFRMAQAVVHILKQFEQLSESERRELRRAIAERVPMSDDLTDEDFAALAVASFRALDEEENARRA